MPEPDHPATHPGVLAIQEAGRRAARGGAPRSVLLLHLAALANPRPHHGRVARAILTNVAERLEGEVLRLPSNDLALLCPRRCATADLIGPEASGPDGLPAVLQRLFGAAERAEHPLFTVWRLPEQNQALHRLLTRPIAPAPAPRAASPPAASPSPTSLHRQTAVRWRMLHGTTAVEPCFREIRTAADPWPTPNDPFLARHAAAALDRQTLTTLLHRIERDGALDGAAPGANPRLPAHLNLGPAAILSPAFEILAARCTERSIQLGVELPLIDAAADSESFHAARDRLLHAGAILVLDHVWPAALVLTRPAALGADLVKLVWQPTLPSLGPAPRAALDAALRDLGLARIVLDGADDEAAVSWGRAAGITRFQGRQIDAMLAAASITASTHAGLFELRDRIDQTLAETSLNRRDPAPRHTAGRRLSA